MLLKQLGWNNFFEEQFQKLKKEGFFLGRISIEHKNIYDIYTKQGKILGRITGKMHFKENFPVVGDWVVLSFIPGENNAVIHHLLKRQNNFTRKLKGKTVGKQVLAANLNIIFVLSSLTKEFNIRRIERYVTLINESNIKPVVLLSKADLCKDWKQKKKEVENVINAPVHVISSFNDKGINKIKKKYIKEGITVALLGSSGVGKSTLINHIIGEELQEVKPVREDFKGRHTTTHRELIILNEGGVIIDTPGMREIQIWDEQEKIDDSFEDIDVLAKNCQFRNCKHNKEKNCAVQEKIKTGDLEIKRLLNYKKMKEESEHINLRKKMLVRKMNDKRQDKKFNLDDEL